MRPVPSRRSSILGTLPSSRLGADPIPERLTKVLKESASYADLPFVPEAANRFLILDSPAQAFASAVSYADFAWLAVRLLGEARLEAFRHFDTLVKEDKATPADVTPRKVKMAEKYRERVLTLLEKLNPYGEFNASRTRPDPNVPAGRVSWRTLLEIPSETGNLLQDQDVPKAKAAVKALGQRIDELGKTIGMYDPGQQGTGGGRFWFSDLRSPVAPGESFVEAAGRWALTSQSQSNAAPSSPLATLVSPTTAPAAAPAAPASSTPDPFAPPAPPAPSGLFSGLPSWALPVAAGVAGALGLALLFGPSGSNNRD